MTESRGIDRKELLQFPEERRARRALANKLEEIRARRIRDIQDLLSGVAARDRERLAEILSRCRTQAR